MPALVLASVAVKGCHRTKFKLVTKYIHPLMYILLHMDMYMTMRQWVTVFEFMFCWLNNTRCPLLYVISPWIWECSFRYNIIPLHCGLWIINLLGIMDGGESPRFAEFCISCECRRGGLAQFFPYFLCHLILKMWWNPFWHSIFNFIPL